MTAELTPTRKAVRCANRTPLVCGRTLALRVRHPSGIHFLVTHRDWRPVGGPRYEDGVLVPPDRWERPWARREGGHQAERHPRRKSAMAWDPATHVPVMTAGPFRCGCGEDVVLDADVLDVIAFDKVMSLMVLGVDDTLSLS